MEVRKLEEMGENLQTIIKRLCANQKLLKLLYYSDKDPYSHADLTAEDIKEKIFEKLIKVIPKTGSYESAQSLITLVVPKGIENLKNSECMDIIISFEIFVPLTQWIFKDETLRPFAIMGQIITSLRGKTINGFGKMSGGDFALNFLTEEMSCYKLTFMITTYE